MPSARRATNIFRPNPVFHAISIHALREEGDWSAKMHSPAHSYFYPCPPRGGRRISFGRILYSMQFLSTPSVRRATQARRGAPLWTRNFYPRPPRGGRPSVTIETVRYKMISIHVLREEGDCQLLNAFAVVVVFLSTPSVRRATDCAAPLRSNLSIFLSTPSARRATRHHASVGVPLHISIHALREEGDADIRMVRFHSPISIHALREEGDALTIHLYTVFATFLSTPSARRATLQFSSRWFSSMYFYPRPPRGGRPLWLPLSFLHAYISIHALREEGDHPGSLLYRDARNFYPRPPRGGRPGSRWCKSMRRGYFYPRPPRGGRRGL